MDALVLILGIVVLVLIISDRLVVALREGPHVRSDPSAHVVTQEGRAMEAIILVAWIAIIVALAAVGVVAGVDAWNRVQGDHERRSSGGIA